MTGRKTASDAWERTPEQREVCKVLEKVADKVGAKNITAGRFLRCNALNTIS